MVVLLSADKTELEVLVMGIERFAESIKNMAQIQINLCDVLLQVAEKIEECEEDE